MKSRSSELRHLRCRLLATSTTRRARARSTTKTGAAAGCAMRTAYSRNVTGLRWSPVASAAKNCTVQARLGTDRRTGGPLQCTMYTPPPLAKSGPCCVTAIGDELGMWRRIVTAAAAATAEAGRVAPTAAFGGSSRPGLRQTGSTISAMRLRGGGANVKQPAPDAAAVTHARLLILLSGAIYGTYPVFLRVCAHDVTRPP